MVRFAAACVGVVLLLGPIGARATESATAESRSPDAGSQSVLDAERSGLAAVKFIPADSRTARIVVTNVSDRPLTLRLPQRFAGVPAVLAQMGVQMQPLGGQAVAGGAGPQNAGMGIGGPMGGNPFCWVAREVYGVADPRWLLFRTWLEDQSPAWLRSLYRSHGEAFADWIHDRPVAKAAIRGCMDLAIAAAPAAPAVSQLRLRRGGTPADAFELAAGKSRSFSVTTVCLQHGRPEPHARMAYRLVALDEFSTEPRLAALIDALARGELSQRVAQAAAWHITDGLSWEQLAAKQIDHAGGYPDEPFFSAEEIVAAGHAIAYVDRITAKVPAPSASAAD